MSIYQATVGSVSLALFVNEAFVVSYGKIIISLNLYLFVRASLYVLFILGLTELKCNTGI